MLGFRCKVCAEKDARINDLKSEIEALRKMVSPATSASDIPRIREEADAILSGSDFPTPLNPAALAHLEELQAEANAILTGTF